MPAIIATLKSWKSSSKVPKVEIASEKTALSTEERIAQLEKQVQELTQRLTALEGK